MHIYSFLHLFVINLTFVFFLFYSETPSYKSLLIEINRNVKCKKKKNENAFCYN